MDPKVPPHDLDAEKSVLAAILIDKDAMIKVSELLKPDSFYSKAHQVIFSAMLELYDKRMAIDVITLKDQLTKDKNIRTAGGISGISQLSNLLSTAANVENYASMVKEKYVKRELIALSNEIPEPK